MTRRTLRSLWSHYLRVRQRLAEAEISGVERRMAEREARGLRDRLVVNYSPLVKYVAGRISGRMAGPLDPRSYRHPRGQRRNHLELESAGLRSLARLPQRNGFRESPVLE